MAELLELAPVVAVEPVLLLVLLLRFVAEPRRGRLVLQPDRRPRKLVLVVGVIRLMKYMEDLQMSRSMLHFRSVRHARNKVNIYKTFL